MNISTVRHGRVDVRLEQEKQSHLEAQEHGRELAKQWAEGDSDPTTSLPLCTLVIEIVDREEKVAPILHRPPETMESQSLRKLYDYVEFCTPTSKSCVLFLRTNHPFRGIFERDHDYWSPSVPADTLVLGLRILPPLASRQPCVSLPAELLYMIFNQAKMVDENWRKLMFSLALVCRAWSRPALDTTYKEFGLDREVSISRLANTLEYYPVFGEKIRLISTSGLFYNNVDEPDTSWEADILKKSRALFTILQTAKTITALYSSGIHRELAQVFVHTLGTCTNLREFESLNLPNTSPSYVYLPNAGDILRCLTHWPHLCKLVLSNVPPAIASDDLPTRSITCTITFVKFCLVSLDLPQLRLLTTSWKFGLREAWLAGISNLTNKDLRMWLSEVGPTLERLRLHNTVDYSNSSIEGEYALDATLPLMSNLVYLDFGGNVGTHLVLQRFAPAPLGRRHRLWIREASGVTPDQILNAMNTTAWTDIKTALLWNQRGELSEEVQRIATRRNIRITNAKS